VVLILELISASLISSSVIGGGPGADSSSGMDVILNRLGDVGGDSELRRPSNDADRLCLRMPVGDEGFVEFEKENIGEGEV
jgi:hypothetical protein